MAGGAASLSLGGVSIPSVAAGGRAASPPSLTGRERLFKGQKRTHSNKSQRRRPRAAAPGRRRTEPGSGAAVAAARRGSLKKRLGVKRAVELLGPPSGRSSPPLPRRDGAQRGPAAEGCLRGSPQRLFPSSATGESAAYGPPLQAPACRAAVGLAPLPAPAGLAAPCGRLGLRRKSPGRDVPRGVVPHPPEVAASESLPPPKGAGLELRLGSPLCDFFKLGRQIARSAVVVATVNPDCAEIS